MVNQKKILLASLVGVMSFFAYADFDFTEGNLKATYISSERKARITGVVNKTITGSLVIPKELNGYPISGIHHSAFLGCSSITSIFIEEGIVTIGDNVFKNCTSLESVKLPSGITEIGYCAFMNCTKLNSIIIPESVTHINTAAFKNCTSLKNVIIPENVCFIGSEVFSGCDSLTFINIPKNVALQA